MVCSIAPVEAQDLKTCGTDEVRRQLIEQYPEILEREQAFDKLALERLTSIAKIEDEKIIIPVVFHIIHDYGPENISDEQVYDAIAHMNADYSKTNTDFLATIPEFTGVAADCNIEFRLAQKELSGGCTNGIDRIPSLRTYTGDDAAKLGGWQSGHYLNIWVVKDLTSGAAAYAYYPTSIAGIMYTVDGVICLYNYVGTIGAAGSYAAHVLSHEVGHYLNLQHVWGNTNSPGVACGDDQISDTPMTEGWTTCNIAGNTCGGAIDNVQNHMEYSYCTTMFTEGQKLRMYAALESEDAMRNNLPTDENLLLTGTNEGYISSGCIPKADFYSNYRLICSGNSVTFFDKSFNADVTALEWTFEGGIPSTSTEVNPVVSFDATGWHRATLSVSNASGSTTKDIENYLYVSPLNADLNETYFENFNDVDEVKNNWIFYNKYPDDFAWDWRSTNGYWNTGCIWLNSRYGPDQETDQVISPSFDLSLGNTDNLFFKYSTTSPGVTAADYTMSLKLYYSINCGESWIYFNKITGQDLISSYGGSTNFFPTSSDQWASADFNLPEACKTNNVKFKIEFVYNSYVNNVFIDDFNFVSGFLTIPETATMISMQVNPDPVELNANAIVRFNLQEMGNITYSITDLSGKIISTVRLGNLNEGNHECTINPSSMGLARGCYFIIINDGIKSATNKFIVV